MTEEVSFTKRLDAGVHDGSGTIHTPATRTDTVTTIRKTTISAPKEKDITADHVNASDRTTVGVIPKAVQVQIPRCSILKQPPLQVVPSTVTPVGNGASSASHGHNSTNPNSNGTLPGNMGSSAIIGRIKAKPVCRIPSLRKEHMSSDEMSKWCFTENDVWTMKQIQADSQVFSHNDDAAMTELDGGMMDNDFEGIDHAPISPKEWKMHKKNILNQNESRNGRETQRFATDPQTGQLLRLTTGCVPIMKDGKILLVSSSRKGEWILPKGGWESDETMEVSALRETYEEGGILGVIGPRLGGIDFETRKAKIRRLELESSLKKKDVIACNTTMHDKHQDATAPNPASSTVSVQSNASSLHSQSEDDTTFATATTERKSPNNRDCLATKIRNELNSNRNNSDRQDDSASIASSNSSICTHVRLSMFPLYVLEVREDWPESGRARKVVDIDTAIEAMASRPEFHQFLKEVKRKGYHLKPYNDEKLSSESVSAGVETITVDDQVETILSESII